MSDLCFLGELEELKEIVKKTGFLGDWNQIGNGFQFRKEFGKNKIILNWYDSSGSVVIQGTPGLKEKDEFQQKLSEILNQKKDTVNASQQKHKIFVVHGHDDTAREQLKLILYELGLSPYVLMNSSGNSSTLIEALEKEIGNGSFGIVLMTPDDKGYALRDGEGSIKLRARQNVILEMGMLFSSLKRGRVALLVKGNLELPSDIDGVIRVHFKNHVKETVAKLSEHLINCGIEISQNQIIKAMQ